jgi:hypothetical protein
MKQSDLGKSLDPNIWKLLDQVFAAPAAADGVHPGRIRRRGNPQENR